MYNAIVGVTRIHAENITIDDANFTLGLVTELLLNNPDVQLQDVYTHIERIKFNFNTYVNDTYAVFLASAWIGCDHEYIMDSIMDMAKLVGRLSQQIKFKPNQTKSAVESLNQTFIKYTEGALALKSYKNEDEMSRAWEIDQKHLIVALNHHNISYISKYDNLKSKDNVFYLTL